MRPGLIEFAQVLAALGLLLGAAKCTGRLFAYFHQPRVIGEIIGGLLLGPTLFSSMFPSISRVLFPETGLVRGVVSAVAQAGLILLMFTSGTELRSFLQRGERKIIAVLTITGTVLPFIAGVLFVLAVDMHQHQGPARNRTAFILVVACAIAVTSIPVISRIMMDLKILHTAFARVILTTAVFEDIVLYVVLAVALGLVRSQAPDTTKLSAFLGSGITTSLKPVPYLLITFLFIAAILVVGLPLLRRHLQLKFLKSQRVNSIVVQLLFLFVVVGLSMLLGVTPVFGAFAAGIVAGRIRDQSDIDAREAIKRVSLAFFIPIYFAMVGFRLDLIQNLSFSFLLFFLLFACLIKGLSIYTGARAAGKPHASALNLAVALNARGGPGIVVASLAFDSGIVSKGFFAILVMVAIVTSLMAGSWLGRVARSGRSLL